ncbi:PepSY domain-containing protein [Cytobacillus sp. FSL K6-0265]|uniref:PepSY domain-containing protein n=1 Tax=Cytobacillus sp. FSL K6-0265 TaxID=2921448 RepID=UPI0030F75671
MMKKFSLLLSIMTIFCLTACGDGDGDGDSNSKNIDKPNLAEAEIEVSLQNAVDIFLREFEVDDITKVELDSDMDQWKYDVAGITNDKEYELVIDAHTGDILNKSEEGIEKGEKDQGISLNEVISPSEAIKIVQAETSNEIGGWTLEVENGTEQYEIEVRDGSEEIDYIIHAISGELEGRD